MKAMYHLRRIMALTGLGVVTATSIANAQSYSPANWVVDPYQTSDFTVSGGNTTTPTYTDNGSGLGNLWGYSPIGATLSLVNPGDTITLSGQMTLAGNVNNSNLQLRYGLLYDNGSANDTGWLGYVVGFPNASAQNVLYMRNNPNTGIFASGTGATQAGGAGSSFGGSGLAADTFNYSLSISLVNSTTTAISWDVTGTSTSYSFSGSYDDTSVSTMGGLTFDQVGFLGGGSTWSSASTSDVLSFSDQTVTLTPVPEPGTCSLVAGALSSLILLRRYRGCPDRKHREDTHFFCA